MKNVWILERFVTAEEEKNNIALFKKLLAEAGTDEYREKEREVARSIISNKENLLKMNPNGYWLGYVGKSNYKTFCYDAKDFMKRHENDLLKSGIRVVKAQINDDAKYWLDYTNAIVNDGVTRYLYATYKK